MIAASPVQGVKNSKPRFRPKGKTSEITRERVSKLSEEYIEIRNRAQAARAESEEIALPRRRVL